jgi:hypothetical protein
MSAIANELPFEKELSKSKQLFGADKESWQMDVLVAILKRQLPFLIGGTITGIIMTYYYGFLFSIVVNSAIWIAISYIVNKHYYKSTGFKDEKYLMQYTLAELNFRRKRE